MSVEKMSVSFDLDLGAAIRHAASLNNESVSGWLAEAARDRLRRLTLEIALQEWEETFGALTEAEIEQARKRRSVMLDESPEQAVVS